ncbi:MAG: hypothetical protein IPL98_18885 [Saprospiraceae bacterium]|nr:hypothetical protein [Saprospiraceae bacterium]
MKLPEFKLVLEKLEDINIVFGKWQKYSFSFSLMKGQVDKKCHIYCGGTIRFERKVGFQLWESTDVA